MFFDKNKEDQKGLKITFIRRLCKILSGHISELINRTYPSIILM